MWSQSGERKPEGSAQRIDVGPRIDQAASKLLRTREAWCANKFPMRQIHFSAGIRHRLGQTEIDDLHFRLRCQHDIAWLQIAMDQTVGCRSHQSPRDLNRNSQSLLCGKWAI